MSKLSKKQKAVSKKKTKAKKKVVAKKKITAKKKATVKKKVKGKRIGRPPYEITDKVCRKARSLASKGLTVKQIAIALGMGETTLIEKQIAFPAFAASIKKGRVEGIKVATSALFEKVKRGDNTAMIFYLKNRDPENWKDVHKHQLSGADDEPLLPSSITIEVVRPGDK